MTEKLPMGKIGGMGLELAAFAVGIGMSHLFTEKELKYLRSRQVQNLFSNKGQEWSDEASYAHQKMLDDLMYFLNSQGQGVENQNTNSSGFLNFDFGAFAVPVSLVSLVLVCIGVIALAFVAI